MLTLPLVGYRFGGVDMVQISDEEWMTARANAHDAFLRQILTMWQSDYIICTYKDGYYITSLGDYVPIKYYPNTEEYRAIDSRIHRLG